MINIIRKAIVFAIPVFSSLNSFAGIWKFDEHVDEFSDQRSYHAYFYEVPDHYKSQGIGLRCDIDKYSRVRRSVTFNSEDPIAFYSGPVTIQLKVGEEIYSLSGQTYPNSMDQGYSEVTDIPKLRSITEALLKGNKALVRVRPDGNGEYFQLELTLQGSAKMINQLLAKCPLPED